MIRAKKRYGQNFLTDKNILRKIVESVDIQQDDVVLEVGTGHGVLTRELDSRARTVISYEIDKELYAANTEALSMLSHTQLIEGDFLSIPLPQTTGTKFKVIANIPYYITTPIIEKLILNKDIISSIYLMVQREVADRLVASPGSKDYGSFTIFVDYHCQVTKLFNVSRNSFRPVPNVDSAFIELVPRTALKVKVLNETLFFNLVHAAFWGRRKTIATAIKNYQQTSMYKDLILRALTTYDIPPQIRGEKLSIEQFALLANYISLNY